MIQSQVNTESFVLSNLFSHRLLQKFSCCSVFACGNLSSQPLNDDFLGMTKRAVILQGGAGFVQFSFHQPTFKNVHFMYPASTCYNLKFQREVKQND